MAKFPVPPAVLELLAANGLSPETRLYREAMFRDLAPTGTGEVFLLRASMQPSETVVDVYGEGHLIQADTLGRGLAFAESSRPNWQETMELRAMRGVTAAMPEARVEVEVLVADILAQGGRVYPVESVTVERAWFCTLPIGAVDVRIVV